MGVINQLVTVGPHPVSLSSYEMIIYEDYP